jgi:5-formyltetrahydrofolate cyclo-ligase
MRHMRCLIPQDVRTKAAQRIAQHALLHPLFSSVSCVAGYVAMHDELDVMPLLKQLSARGVTLTLPRVDTIQNLLQFHLWREAETLISHPTLGVREPTEYSQLTVPEVILTPLLGYDAQGSRLGYGGGWYDRTLHNLRRMSSTPLAIGVGYRIQQCESLPCAAQDERLDGILHEDGLVLFS